MITSKELVRVEVLTEHRTYIPSVSMEEPCFVEQEQEHQQQEQASELRRSLLQTALLRMREKAKDGLVHSC